MKNKIIFKKLLLYSYISIGIGIFLFFIIKWIKIGFRIGFKYHYINLNKDGNFYLIMVLVGLSIVLYSIFELKTLDIGKDTDETTDKKS